MAERRLTLLMPEVIHVDGAYCGEGCEHLNRDLTCSLFYDTLKRADPVRAFRCDDCVSAERAAGDDKP